MLGLRNETSQTETFSPRAHLAGLDNEALAKLAAERIPPLEAVRADAAKLPTLQSMGGPARVNVVFTGREGETLTEEPQLLPEALSWNTTLPHLFTFSYFALDNDVPNDLLEPVIFALKMFIRVVQETPEQMLRTVGHIRAGQSAEIARSYMVLNSREKLVSHLLNPIIDRPSEALEQMRLRVKATEDELGKPNKVSWIENPLLYDVYGHALTLAGHFTLETRTVLEHVLEGVDLSPEAQSVDFRSVIIRAHIHLALVLEQLGNDPQAQREYLERATNFIRKNPILFYEAELKQMIARSDQPPHPVLTALGGPKWFEHRKSTQRVDERAQKRCRNCGLHDQQKPVFRCSQCQWTYYCSKECQRADWKLHKDGCREAVESRKKAEALKQTNLEAGQMAEDWYNWRQAPNTVDTAAMIHALHLQRDPSRGRTHIIFREATYTPGTAKTIRNKFQVVRCGVYRIQDVLSDIEDVMGLNKGEGQEYIQSLITELDATDRTGQRVPILELKFAAGLETWLSSDATTLNRLRMTPYDPHWRKLMNPKHPPGPMIPLKSGAEDAEHRF